MDLKQFEIPRGHQPLQIFTRTYLAQGLMHTCR